MQIIFQPKSDDSRARTETKTSTMMLSFHFYTSEHVKQIYVLKLHRYQKKKFLEHCDKISQMNKILSKIMKLFLRHKISRNL